MEPEQPRLTFAEAFERDLKISGLEQAEVAHMLSDPDEPFFTTAAISNWKARNRAPARRLRKLVEIFGPESWMARFAAQFQADMDHYNQLRQAAEASKPARGLAPARFSVREGAFYYRPNLPEQLNLDGLRAMLEALPEDKRARALSDALKAVAQHLISDL